MNEYQYKSRIFGNIFKLENLSAKEFPFLHKFLYARKGAQLKRLLFILEMARDTENQERDRWGYWLILPQSRMVELGKEFGVTALTWYRAVILFASMGLIKREIPTEETANTPYRKRAIEYAIKNGDRKAAQFIQIPNYSARQLKYIEKQAKKWIKRKATTYRLSKSTIIEVFGTCIADRVYQDERHTPFTDKEAEAQITKALVSILATSPYTTKEAVIQAAARKLGRQLKVSRDVAQIITEKAWGRAHTRLLKAESLVYKRPTAAEIERFSLPGHGWIIFRDDAESRQQRQQRRTVRKRTQETQE